MSPLLKYREKRNLTQEELAELSGVSVRTIQRIEAGIKPKGHTLKALSKALEINQEELLTEEKSSEKSNKQVIKYINLSSIILLVIPLGSIIMPLIIMNWKKEVNAITKQIISIQILWTLAFPLVMVIVNILGNEQTVPLAVVALIITNLFIIIRNAVEIEKHNKLYIRLNFNFI